MYHCSPTHRANRLLLSSLFALSFGCATDQVGAAKLEALSRDMPFGIVVDKLGKGPLLANQPEDSEQLFGGYRRDLIETASGSYTLLWYRETPGTLQEPHSPTRETPLLFGPNGRLLAIGWDDCREKSTDLSVPVPALEATP